MKSKIITKSFLVFAAYSLVLWRCCTATEVKIQQGALRGNSQLSRNGSKYYEFLSIPFAKPPIKKLRFQPPQAPDSWNDTKDATKLPPACLQSEMPTIDTDTWKARGQEDCLYLNVYTPEEKSQPLPVMVFIHGGAFTSGASFLYGPQYFMDHKVILVIIQYRLNVFGFLSTGDHILPGNNGMKDQVAALQWIQKNIAAFGGDPGKVTIFGQSAGAASVHYHLHSPLSKGLFHRAISHSGTSLAMWAYTPRNLARQRANALGILAYCPTEDSKALIDCLENLPAEELLLAHEKFYIWDFEPTVIFSVVDEPANAKGTFITENPWYHEIVNNVPWIVGMTSGEGGVKASRFLHSVGERAAILNNDYKRLFPVIFYYGSWMNDETKIAEVTETLRSFYFDKKDIGSDTAHALVDLYTDGFFTRDILKAARRHKQDVYLYYYDHRNQKSFNEIYGDFTYKENLGVCHGDDLISLFYIQDLSPEVADENDFEVSERLVQYWVNFANSGNPNNNEPKWTPVASDDLEYLHITTEADIMKKELLKDRYQFWNSLPLVSPPAQPPPKSATGVLGVVTSVIDTIKGFFGRIFGTN